MFLLASDFDRTFYINNYDFKCNLKLLPEFMKSNVFAIVTGRSYDDYMNVTKNCIPVNYLIINHGATILKDDIVINSTPISNKTVTKLKKIFNFDDLEYFACKDKFSRVDIDTKDLSKINITMQDNLVAKKAVDYINRYFDDIKAYILFHKNQLEIVSARANKRNAVKYIANLENINRYNIYTVGDGYTDFEMIKDYNGYCMSDCVSELKNVAIKSVDSVGNIINYLTINVSLESVSKELTQFVNDCFEYKNYFEKYMGKIYKDYNSKNHIVIRKDNQIIATALIVPNKIYLEDYTLNVLTIGSICVKREYRKQGYFKMLMRLIKDKSKDYDLSILSGDLKRYRKYNFYPNLLNLYRISAKESNIDFKKIDNTKIDDCINLYNKRKVHAIRNKSQFIDICAQWKGEAYYIYKDNLFIGYIIFNTKKDYVSEINGSNIIESLESFAKFKKREYINVSFLSNDYDNLNNFKDLKVSRTYNRQLYFINDIKRVIEVCLKYKAQYFELAKGSVSIKIDDCIIRITVLNNITVEEDDKYDIELTYEQAIELFLNKKMSRNKLLSSWFPIDLDIYNNDLV